MEWTVGSNRKDEQLELLHDKQLFVEVDIGSSLLTELDTAVTDLHNRFPNVSFVVEDRYGVTVRTVTGEHRDASSTHEWRSMPLTLNRRHFGCIRYCGPLGTLTILDITPIVLSLSQLENWMQTEGERRGEKVQKVLSEGLTPEVVRLLSMCGLNEHPGYTLVAMELASQTDKFLYMDVLRRFMLARIWGYRASSIDFVANRPGGLLAIFPNMNMQRWAQQLEEWLEQWNQFQSRLEIPHPLEVRACITTVDTLYKLDSALREIEATMQFAARWNLVGLVRTHVSHSLSYILSNVSEHHIAEFVHRTLGPILVPEHLDLLHTLRVYLSLDQNVTETARALYVHRNTLLYRIRRIEELLGIRLRSTPQLSMVWIALEGLELLETSGKKRLFL
jgi:hypothetical protein